VTSSNRINYLDGLRGVLALIVFVHHFLYAFYPEIIFGGNYQEFLSNAFNFKKFIALTPINIVFNPGMAILFFFLLSGYVQTQSYFENNNLLFLQKSFIKRYFRLAVPTLLVLLLVFVFQKLHLVHNNWFPQNNLSGNWAKSLLPDNMNFFQVIYHGVFECFMGNTRYYQILWTMPIELLNSYIVLILCMSTHGLKNKVWFFVAWLLVQLFFLHSYNGAAFTFGMLFAFFRKSTVVFQQQLERPAIKYSALILGVYFASYPYTGYQGAVLNSIYRPISFFEVYPHIISFLIGSVLLFAAFSSSVRIQKLLGKKLFLFFGKISFMFSLVHFLLLFSFSPWLYRQLISSVSFEANMLITATVSLMLICLVSLVLHKIVDAPVVSLCNRYVNRIFVK